MNATGAQVLQR